MSNLIKLNNSWTNIKAAYKKENDKWVRLSSDLSTYLLGSNAEKNYVDYNSPKLEDSSIFLINGLTDIQTANNYIGGIITNSGVTESTNVPNENFGKSLYFNGSAYFTMPNYDFADNDFTIEWWEKPASDTAGTRFMSTFGTGGGTECGAMFGWYCTTDLMPEIKWTSGDDYTTYKWNVIGHGVSAGNMDTSWHHMAYVRSGSNLYVIKDSQLLNTIDVGTNEMGCNMSLPMAFGRRGSDAANGNCYSGYLCGIRFSNTALYTQFGTYNENIEPAKNEYQYGEHIGPLPIGYTELEYIESSGTQYINTEVIPGTANFAIKMRGNPVSLNTTSNFFATMNINYESAAGGYAQFGLYGGEYAIHMTNVTVDGTTPATNSEVELIFTVNGSIATLSGSATHTVNHSSFSTGNYLKYPIVVAQNYWKTKHVQIIHNGQLVRNLIPCKDPNGAVGMYDSIQGKFYGNGGTGAFIPGPEKQFLPPEFIELKYIESTGTQYIDTKFKANSNTRVLMDAEATSTTTGFYFGGRTTAQSKTYTFVHLNGTQIRSDFNTTQSAYSITSALKRMRIDKNGATCKSNENTISNTAGTFQCDYSLFLFTANHAGFPDTSYISAKLYRCTIYDNGTIVRDFIPCQSKTSKAIGLYDVVNNVFYQNKGAGVFIPGPEIIKNLPQGYRQIEYIQSNGTQHINTNHHWLNENAKVYMRAIVTSNSSSQTLFGNEEYITTSARNFAIIPHGANCAHGFYVGAGMPAIGAVSSLFTLNKKFEIECETNPLKFTTAKVNGVLKGSASYTGSIMTYYNGISTAENRGKIYIFANHNEYANGSAGIQQIGGMQLFSFKMWDNNTLVRDFIPCINDSDVAGLYDIVNNVFYSNAGSGSFTIGPVI